MTQIIIKVGNYSKDLRLKDPTISEMIENKAIEILKEIKDKTGYVGAVENDDGEIIYYTVNNSENEN
jgi:hypothetical protein